MIIRNAVIVNEGVQFRGHVILKGKVIQDVLRTDEPLPRDTDEEEIDAQGCYLLPGIIDEHVHMRDPGLTHKGDMHTETMAAAAGGVTTVLDMPNVSPLTTTNALLEEKYKAAQEKCHVNYGFFLGATRDNLQEIKHVDRTKVPGIKLFMGSSTGNMLVADEEALQRIFEQCPTLLMTHCEDASRINQRTKEIVSQYGKDPEISFHPLIRDREACLKSTQLAVKLARQYGTRLHVAHLSTAEEVALFSPNDPQITAEACIPHLLYTDQDYTTLGTRIKCNPAIKTAKDRKALRTALKDGRITCVATDHAPHLLSEKQGGCLTAMSGMPMVQFSLPSMLQLAEEGVVTLEDITRLMAHNPASLFRIEKRGFIRPGYYADLVLVRPHQPWTVTEDKILSKCKWSPRTGDTLQWKVEKTWVNGELVWDGENINTRIFGSPVRFCP